MFEVSYVGIISNIVTIFQRIHVGFEIYDVSAIFRGSDQRLLLIIAIALFEDKEPDKIFGYQCDTIEPDQIHHPVTRIIESKY